jgi:acetylornithine/N-succinyldiaminopimelate aminotransferase
MGALAVTGQPGYREGFGPLSGAIHVPFGDIDAVKGALGPDVAAIIVEPIQGEGGVLPAPAGFLAALRQICDEQQILLLADEVQTGIGRTGRWLAFEHAGVRADATALAKGLGGGFPMGAMLCREKFASVLPPGSHGTTFGGNALASRAALTVLEVLGEEGFLAAVTTKGEQRKLKELASRYPNQVETARGLGLLQALVLREGVDARRILQNAQTAGLLLTIAGGRGLRFSPALTVTIEELDEGVRLLESIIKAEP